MSSIEMVIVYFYAGLFIGGWALCQLGILLLGFFDDK